jgi:dTDP-4-amino-4,6-dideoxygalactose transaminase
MKNSKDFLPFNKPFIAGKELHYISEAIFNGAISGNAKFTKLCEQWLEKNLQCKSALFVHSCTAALEIAAMLLNIEPGDEVVMPSFTFVSTANAFVLRGGIPIFVDIEANNLGLDPQQVLQAITPATKAIVPVHYAGVQASILEIVAIAKKYNIPVVEDAAQGLLNFHEGSALGTFGDLGAISFHETKNVICGEGGALLINKEEFIERAHILRDKGTNRRAYFNGEVDKYTWIDLGSSYPPSDIVAAFLYGQLEHAWEITLRRKNLWQLYMSNLESLSKRGYFETPKYGFNKASGHLFYILTENFEERTNLISFMKSQGVYTVFHYVPLHSSPAGRKYGKTCGELKVTENISERLVRLPIYHEMSPLDVERVCSLIKKFYEEKTPSNKYVVPDKVIEYSNNSDLSHLNGN